MNKRGDMQLFTIFSILMALAVIASLGYYVYTFKNSRQIEKRANTIEMGLALDTLYLCDGAKVVYNINKEDSLHIGEGYVNQGLFKFGYVPSKTKRLSWNQDEDSFEVSS
jgi:hypothetical protein